MEEDLETLEDLKNIFIHLKNYGWVNDIKRDVVADKVIKAIENLIARNKELENADLTTIYLNGFYDGEKKWKDKIKQRAIEYEKNNNRYDCTTATYGESQDMGKYLAYIELLKERN